jgi:signal transduction histidine kinase
MENDSVLNQDQQAFENYMNALIHDLRGPIGNVISFSELLMEGEYSKEENDGFTAIINGIGKKMKKMLDSYLLLAKIERGQGKIEKTPILVIQLINKIKAIFSGINGKHKLHLKLLNMENDSAKMSELIQKEVFVDETLMFSLIINLLTNSLDAIKGTKEEVTVDIYEESNIFCLSVLNKGEIPEKIREKLFQKFVTAGKENGTGLGLFSAKLIAQAHGGDLYYEPLPGSTKFILKIPFK